MPRLGINTILSIRNGETGMYAEKDSLARTITQSKKCLCTTNDVNNDIDLIKALSHAADRHEADLNLYIAILNARDLIEDKVRAEAVAVLEETKELTP